MNIIILNTDVSCFSSMCHIMHDPARLHKFQSFSYTEDENEAMAKKLSKADYTCRLRGHGIRLAQTCPRSKDQRGTQTS